MESRLVLILLTGVNAGPPRVAGANIKYEVRTKRVCPGAPVVAALATAGGRSPVANRIENCDVLLRVAEEDAVVVAEAMIDSDLETICVVGRRTDLCEVV